MALPIFAGPLPVAAIHADREGPRIIYEPPWLASREAFPISLSMPLVGAEWRAEVATPWLRNLLPEGEPMRAMMRALGVAREDVIGLIERTGRDLAGALTIGSARPGERPDFVSIVGEEQLERIIEELPSKPFLVGDDGVSMSLAGAQEKIPLALIDGQLAVPINGAASTHILKPDNPRLHGSVQNEALCMVLARRCGLSVADVQTGLAGKRSFLLVTRYDRVGHGDGVERLHQEDFCQALGRPPSAKYEHNGSGIKGPSLPEMFHLVREHMTARDINQLLDAVIFNIAIGNVVSHAKNYSALLAPHRSELAPLYDLMSGLAWANITQNHAQDVGGQRRGRHIYGRHWKRMAEAAGLAGLATVRRVGQVATRILAELPMAVEEVAAMPAGGEMLDIFGAEIAARAQTVLANAQQEGEGEPEQEALPEAGATKYA